MTPLEALDVTRFFAGIKNQVIAQGIVGQEHVIDGLLAALATGGHVLLESNPGLGKTTMAKSFARSLKLGARFGRIQFTPDLLPSDITGTKMPTYENGVQVFRFEPGPIFHSILLADEINRATPKTQAAMLEAMAEQQVTILGEQYRLTEAVTGDYGGRQIVVRTPFMVIATQNPIDQEGTYELPEAQADRFQLKLLMDPPATEDLVEIVRQGPARDRMAGEQAAAQRPDRRIEDQKAFPNLAALHRVRTILDGAELPPWVLRHAVYIVQATNGTWGLEDMPLVPERYRKELAQFVDRYVAMPLGPRTAMALAAVIKVHALLNAEPDYPEQWTQQLPAAMQAMAPAVLRHRIKLRYDWENDARAEFGSGARLSREQLRDLLIGRLVALTAPHHENYQTFFVGRGKGR